MRSADVWLTFLPNVHFFPFVYIGKLSDVCASTFAAVVLSVLGLDAQGKAAPAIPYRFCILFPYHR